MDNPPWATEERYRTEAARRAHHDGLDERIGDWTATRDRWDVTRLCQDAGVIAAPVLGEADLGGGSAASGSGVLPSQWF